MNKGFSLVELIVVIAIMAILVGVAVPVYTQYIQDAKDSVEEQYADELKRAVDTAYIDIKAGLTESDATDKTVPTSVKIVGDDVYLNGANTVSSASDSAFVDILTSLFTLDADSTEEYTFTLGE